ncbi:murein L,D-transpeptidase catalytic domain family protein [Flavobacterium undicola]|uniref:murein L,D-transpeptidase catalytic domain family protein n=1 Tax=Flavobacterium undicola TaxID=1932779 RepID=UPI001378F34C|nr:murein L,D-transpeptidase catalytic domain family protein [Flavobacterium undicola]
MVYKRFVFFLLLAFLLMSANVFFSKANTKTVVLKSNVLKVNEGLNAEEVYSNLHSANFSLPKLESFKEALNGFYKLKNQGLVSRNIITLIDFSLSANTKRLWVIDLDTDTILLHSLVAHGRNTGDEYANSFSNAPESYKSSLGFYVTGEVYNGKHGKSLKLDGLEKGINDNARDRAVVVHGADYVSSSFIQNNKRLGRSLGCPAIPIEITNELISTIKGKSCLFIYYPSDSYKRSSKLIS